MIKFVKILFFFVIMLSIYCGGSGSNDPEALVNYRWFPRHSEDQFIAGSSNWSVFIRTFLVAGNNKGQSVIANTAGTSLNIQCYEHGIPFGSPVVVSLTGIYSGMSLQTADIDNNGNIYISAFQIYSSGSTTYRYLRVFSMQFGDSILNLLHTLNGNMAAGPSCHTSYIDDEIYVFVASTGTGGPYAVIKRSGQTVQTRNILTGSTQAGGFQVLRTGSAINIFFTTANQILKTEYNIANDTWNIPVAGIDYIFRWSGTAITYTSTPSLASVKLNNGEIHLFFASTPDSTFTTTQHIFHLYANSSGWNGPLDINDTFSDSAATFNNYGHSHIRAASFQNKIIVTYGKYVNYYDGSSWTGEHAITLLGHTDIDFMSYPFFDHGSGKPMATRMAGTSSFFYILYSNEEWLEPVSTNDADYILSPLMPAPSMGQLWYSAYQSKNGKIYTLHLDYSDTDNTRYYTASFSDQDELP